MQMLVDVAFGHEPFAVVLRMFRSVLPAVFVAMATAKADGNGLRQLVFSVVFSLHISFLASSQEPKLDVGIGLFVDPIHVFDL